MDRTCRAVSVIGVLASTLRTSASAFTIPIRTASGSLTGIYGIGTPTHRWPRGRLGLITRDEAEDMTVPTLKDHLKERGLKVGGKKAELVDRLLDSFGSADGLDSELAELCGPLALETESEVNTPGTENDDSSWGGEDVPSYQEYVEELQAMAFLSSIGDEEACDRAQQAFDSMYENYIIEDDASLEPTTEICNLLIEAYAESSKPNAIEMAEKILDRMESTGSAETAGETIDTNDGESETAGATMPPPDINTYTAVLRGYANRAQPMAADDTFRRLYDRFMVTGNRELMPTTEAYNQLIRAWMRSGTRSAASVTEDLLNEMIDANEDDAMPNAETFARVMNCHAQASKGNDAPSNVQRLMDQMQRLYESGIETLKPNTEVHNAKIKSLAVPGVSDGAMRAVDALHWVVNKHREGNNDLRPNRATFISTINAQTTNGGKRAAQEAEKVFSMMQSVSREFKDDELLLNVRVYNALIRCWARSRERNKAERTRQLLETMAKESKMRGDDEVTPNLQSYNGVLNACSFPSRGTSVEEKYAAFRVAVQTLNELQASKICEPNHVSYGTFLRSCGNLMPPSSKRDAVVGNIFRKCCEEGLVSQFVMDSVSHAASESLKSTLFEDMIGGKLPREWSRNL